MNITFKLTDEQRAEAVADTITFLQAENLRLRGLNPNATNTPDYTLREALKAAQEERDEYRMMYVEQFDKRDKAHTKLLDREKRLGLAKDEMLMAENFNQDSPSWKKYRARALAACNLDIPLEEKP